MATNNRPESVFTMPTFGSNYQLSTPPVSQAPNLSFGGPQFNAGTYGGPTPTTGPLAGNYTADLSRQGVNYQTPETLDSSGSGGFSLGDWTKLGSAATQAYLGYKGLGLAEDQFDFAKGSFNVNLANQAKLINTQMEDRERARRGFSGQTYDAASLQAYLKPRQVSGAPI